MNKYKGNNDGKNFDRACEELSRGKEQYKKYIKEIFDSDKDRAILLKRAENYVKIFNSKLTKNFGRIIRDIDKWVKI